MSVFQHFDRTLATWFAEEDPRRAPEGLLSSVLAITSQQQPARTWVARLRVDPWESQPLAWTSPRAADRGCHCRSPRRDDRQPALLRPWICEPPIGGRPPKRECTTGGQAEPTRECEPELHVSGVSEPDRSADPWLEPDPGPNHPAGTGRVEPGCIQHGHKRLEPALDCKGRRSRRSDHRSRSAGQLVSERQVRSRRAKGARPHGSSSRHSPRWRKCVGSDRQRLAEYPESKRGADRTIAKAESSAAASGRILDPSVCGAARSEPDQLSELVAQLSLFCRARLRGVP